MAQITASTVLLHPWSFKYLFYLKPVAVLLRALSSIAQAREFERVQALTLVPAGLTRRRIQVPSRDEGRTITVDVYERERAAKGPRAVHLNFHGSGFVIPSLGSDCAFCAKLAAEVDVVVLDCDYRKAPEAPFPAAHNDALDVYAYISSQPTSFDLSHATLSGFSAGGNLAMGLAVALPPSAIKGLISIYGNPAIYQVPPPAPFSTFSAGLILPAFIRTFFYQSLILPGVDRMDLRLSPALADGERWPSEVFVACGEADSLWQPGKDLVAKLHKDGKRVGWMSVQDSAHAFDKAGKGMSKETKARVDAMYDEAVALVERCGAQ